MSLDQKKLRMNEYIHLRYAVVNDGDVNNRCQLVILLSTFTESPCYINECIQDAITHVQNYGRSNLFATFTCHRKRLEIDAELMHDQIHSDHHDLLASMFRQKSIESMNTTVTGHVLGETRC